MQMIYLFIPQVILQQKIATNLNQDLKKVTNLCARNRLFINKAKTKYMLLCTRQKRMNLESALKIKFDNDGIRWKGSWGYNRYIFMLDSTS